MTVYVDSVRNRYRGMLMCHMWADTMEELLAMVDAIGVHRKWLQQPPKARWVHFDISLERKELALKQGAVQTDKYGAVEHVSRLNGNDAMLKSIYALRSRNAAIHRAQQEATCAEPNAK